MAPGTPKDDRGPSQEDSRLPSPSDQPAPTAVASAGRPGRRLTVLLSVQDHAGHHSLMVELVKRARQIAMAGVTVFEGVTGFGASGSLHRTHLWRDDAPLSLVVVDEPDRVDAYMAAVGDLLADAMLVVEDVTIVGQR